MEFVASMTHRADELKKIINLWRLSGDERNPFSRTIFTPLFARSNVNTLMKDLFKQTGGVIFDSGGYYVQQGAVSYESLYQRLLHFYIENPWADWYVLPDYVPTSSLTPEEVDNRVKATVTISRLFQTEMPENLKSKCIPVVQGYTFEQIQFCIENYVEMGASYIGFGSFGTSGDNNSINTITRQSIQMIEFLKKHTEKHRLKVHLFGIGTPSVLPLFRDLGIDSFDSSCWSRTAGFGNVYLPFMGRRNITGRMLREVGGEAYTKAKFIELRDATGHECPFCRDVDELINSRLYQMMHNLYVLLDTVDSLNAGQKYIPHLIGVQGSRYDNYKD